MAAAPGALPVEQSRRLERMRREPLYLLDASAVITNEGSAREDAVLRYHVSGSTGTMYTVGVERRRLSCTCPDFTAGARRHGVECKHCCFVVYRVLGDAFAAHHFDTTHRRRIGDEQWRRWCDRTRRLHQHQHASGDSSAAGSGGGGANDEQPFDWTHDPAWCRAAGLVPAADYDADASGAELQCAICFDELRAATGSTKLLVQCGTCSKCVHRSCADQWVRTGDHDCCVYCRSPLVYAAVLAERDAHGDAARKRRRTE